MAPLGGSQRTGSHRLAHEAAHAVRQGLAPGQAAAAGRRLIETELDLGREALSDPHAQSVAPPLTRALRVEHAFRAEILPLGVGRREVLEPPRDLVIVTPAEHASSIPRAGLSREMLAFVEAARQTLLAAFFVHQGRLPALLAEVADPAPRRRRGRLRVRLLAPPQSDVLAESSRQSVRQRQDLRGSESGGLASPDQREL